MYGTVVDIDGDDVHLEIAPGVEIRLVRGAIARVVDPGADDGTEDDDEQANETDPTDVVDGGVAGDDTNGVR
jgi:preprotein translocase subunit YajC